MILRTQRIKMEERTEIIFILFIIVLKIIGWEVMMNNWNADIPSCLIKASIDFHSQRIQEEKER